MTKDQGGRPPITEKQKQEILQKLEPYLKSGLSVRKALMQAKIPNSTFYTLMERDDKFKEQIRVYSQFLSIMLNSSLVKELQAIVKKQNGGITLNADDKKFMQWFALNSNLAKDEYGERKKVNVIDPQAEIERIKNLIKEQSLLEGDSDDPQE